LLADTTPIELSKELPPPDGLQDPRIENRPQGQIPDLQDWKQIDELSLAFSLKPKKIPLRKSRFPNRAKFAETYRVGINRAI